MTYRFIPDVEKYHSFVLANEIPYAILDPLDEANPIEKKWTSVQVKLEKSYEMGDFAYLRPGVPVVSSSALEILRPIISVDVEFLPINLESEPFFAIHVLTTLDCLDMKRSEIVRFPSGGIMDIDKFVLKAGCVAEHAMFRLKKAESKYVFVSDEFKSVVTKNNLKGAIFKIVEEA